MIVVVEPSLDERSMIVRALKARNVPSYRMARNAEEVIAMLLEAENARLPRLVLMDLELPVTRGLELVRLLRTDPRTRRVPIACLIDSIDPDSAVEAYDTGASAVLVKPVDFEEYVAMVQKTAEFWIEVAAPAYPPPRNLSH